MSETITLTLDEMQQREKAAVVAAQLDILIGDFRAHKKEEEKELTRIDTHIAEMFSLMREFPEKVAVCKDELEKHVKEEYMTKAEFKTMLRTAMFIGGAALTVVQAAILLLTLSSYFPKHEQNIVEKLNGEHTIEQSNGKTIQ